MIALVATAIAAPCPLAPPDEGVTRLVLLGDAGQASGDDPVLATAAACAESADAVVLLGDNVYGKHRPSALRMLQGGGPYGGLGRKDPLGHAQLLAQLGAFDGDRLYVVPGNHDWYRGRAGVKRERALVMQQGAHWLPAYGDRADDPCRAGVGVAEVGDVRLVGLDSMAALRCGHGDRERLAQGLAYAVGRHGPVVVAAHHPARTIGKHAGRGVSGQDVDGPRYRRHWTDGVLAAARADEDVVLAAGHDHLLAVLEAPDGFALQIVSGAGSAEQENANRRNEGAVDGDRWSFSCGFVVLDHGPEGWSAEIVEVS